MDYSNILEYRPFDFYDTDPYIMLCYELANEKLKEMYPNNTLFASDCFGISIVDDNRSEEITSFSTGRLGKIGPLAMRNESTKEVFPLCQN